MKNNKSFAITSSTAPKGKRTANVRVYCGLLFVAFCFFALYSGVTNMLFSPSKVDIFTKDLNQLAAYFLPVDREVSHKLTTLDTIIQDYVQGENVLQTKAPEIEDLRRYVTEHRKYLSQLGFKNYDAVMDFLAESYAYREELFLLLGKNQPFNYLILLQNGNEKRPNGGFFGSFAFVQLDGGHIKELEVIDSYLPDYIAPTTRIQLPQRFADTFGESKAGFIAGNKFWFTDTDGQNIKLLYERMFNSDYDLARVEQMIDPSKWNLLHDQYIKGVVFLDSNLLEELLPGFTQKARERQFLNATIDLIRGEVKSNKKELYIQQVLAYFDANKITLAKNLINHWSEILLKRYVHIFLSHTTDNLHDFLIQHNLNTPYTSKNIYTRDINTANNKSDAFITKSVQLIGSGVSLQSSNDILDISSLTTGNYRLQIDYDFSVPESYISFITKLTEKYEITLTEREQDILVLGPVQHENKQIPRRRETRGVLYLPSNIEIINVQGDQQAFREFTTDFSKGLLYRVSTNQNHSTMQILIDFKI